MFLLNRHISDYIYSCLHDSVCSLTGCRRDKDGYYWITGRIDDMLNVSGKPQAVSLLVRVDYLLQCESVCQPSGVCFPPGHLMSTAEVEAALTKHAAVAEAAVVSRPHVVKGECLYCFVTLKDSREFNHKLVEELKGLGN